MKTKNLIILNSLLITLFINCSYAQSSDSQIINKLNNFYTAYITANSKMPVNELKVDSILNKYCSSQLLDSLVNKDLDYDPYLNSQDCQSDWLSSVLIEKIPNSNNIFKMSYLNGYQSSRVVIRLTVVLIGSEYKINKIEY